jgi:hypothetical protein
MRGTTAKRIRSTSHRLLGRPLYPTEWCRFESYTTTWAFWRWGRCSASARHKGHRDRPLWYWPFSWGHRGTNRWHLVSEVRRMKRLYSESRRRAA